MWESLPPRSRSIKIVCEESDGAEVGAENSSIRFATDADHLMICVLQGSERLPTRHAGPPLYKSGEAALLEAA
jgi:hypothetical protein